MNIRQILLASVTVLLLGSDNSWAGLPGCDPSGGRPKKCSAQAPEIDAASGTSAIALLTGVLMLAGEKSRSRRS